MQYRKEFSIDKKYTKGIEFIKNKNYIFAEQIFLEIIDNFPNHTQSLFLLGISLYEQKKINVALKYFNKVASLKKNFIDAHYYIGKIYLNKREYNLAKKIFSKLVEKNPENLNYLVSLVIAQINLKEFKDSKILLEKKKKLFKVDEVYQNLMGYLFLNSGNNNLSLNHYLNSYNKNKNNINTLINLANVYLRNSDYINSKIFFEKALNLNPKNPKTLYSYSYFQLYTGEIYEGLSNYEYRKIINSYDQSLLNNHNEWKGENLNKKTLLVLCEQGLGDIIQFSRYVFYLQKKYDVNIIFKVEKKLFHIFKNKNLDLRDGSGELPVFDFFIFLLSMPKIIYSKEKNFLKNYNFIYISKNKLRKWKQKLKNLKGKKIGISWQGDHNFQRDFMRSINLKILTPLIKNKHFNFINLQKGFAVHQIKKLKLENYIVDFSSEMDNKGNAFEDTISIIKNLDIILTTDTAIAHIAGTLEMETWLLLHYNPEWRWQIQNENFIWYPKLKIFRQKTRDDWKSVITDINENLKLNL